MQQARLEVCPAYLQTSFELGFRCYLGAVREGLEEQHVQAGIHDREGSFGVFICGKVDIADHAMKVLNIGQ